jgi:hypothetical protein
LRLQCRNPLLLELDFSEQIFLARGVQADALGDLAFQRRHALAALTDQRFAIPEQRVEYLAATLEAMQIFAKALGVRPGQRQVAFDQAQAPCLRLTFLKAGTG